MHYLLFYDYAPDYLERRAEFRNEHLTLAWQAQEDGELILGGALADPADRGVLLFQCDSPEVPARFAEADPYVRHGLVTRYEIRPWTTVVGQDATSPVRPASDVQGNSWYRLSMTKSQVEEGEIEARKQAFDEAFAAAGAPRIMALFKQEREDGGTDLFFTPDCGTFAAELLKGWRVIPCVRPSLIRLHLLVGHNEITYYMP